MNEPVTAERTRRHWGWWLATILCVTAILTGLRLVYPTIRQQQLIRQLTAKGFTFSTVNVVGSSSYHWRMSWVPVKWRSRGPIEINVSNPRGICTVEDTAALNELVSLDDEGWHSPPRCWFNFSLHNITDGDLAQLPQRIRLIHLTATGQHITDDGIAHLRRAIYLSKLTLHTEHIGDRGLAHLAGMKEMVALRLNSPFITDAGLNHLKGLSKLRFLRLSGTQISDAGLIHLAGLTSLEHLDLSDSHITDAGLVQLSKLPRLRKLVLNGTQITDAGLPHARSLPPKLTELVLQRTKITYECKLNLWNSKHSLRFKGP